MSLRGLNDVCKMMMHDDDASYREREREREMEDYERIG